MHIYMCVYQQMHSPNIAIIFFTTIDRVGLCRLATSSLSPTLEFIKTSTIESNRVDFQRMRVSIVRVSEKFRLSVQAGGVRSGNDGMAWRRLSRTGATRNSRTEVPIVWDKRTQ